MGRRRRRARRRRIVGQGRTALPRPPHTVCRGGEGGSQLHMMPAALPCFTPASKAGRYVSCMSLDARAKGGVLATKGSRKAVEAHAKGSASWRRTAVEA